MLPQEKGSSASTCTHFKDGGSASTHLKDGGSASTHFKDGAMRELTNRDVHISNKQLDMIDGPQVAMVVSKLITH